jgi:hypothetical protein
MTARNYDTIAAILAGDLATCTTEHERYKVRGIAYSLADYFARTNPRFDRQRFYTAVGIGQRYWLGEGVPIPPESVPGYESTNEWTEDRFDGLVTDLRSGRLDQCDLELLEDEACERRAHHRFPGDLR